MTTYSSCPNTKPFSSKQGAVWDALSQKRFFKLIAGGSLTELEKLAFITRVYALAGADCLDVAPVLDVVETIHNTLNKLPEPHPMLMVSLPLDPDPHFRKIELVESDCITCGACLPLCPTDAFSFSDSQQLLVNQPLCYGCGRCVPICPTSALKLNPFWEPDVIIQVLSHPRVEAIELHTQHADPLMLEAFLSDYGHLLTNKLIAYCFRPDQANVAFWAESISKLHTFAPGWVLLQIDGAPMSGNDNLEASRPAIAAAIQVKDVLQKHPGLQDIPITISGGINQHTKKWLTQSENHFISGIGMGTVARKAIWHLEDNEPEALSTAQSMVLGFKK